MKREIDLTDDNTFSRLPSVYRKQYPAKSVPWVRNKKPSNYNFDVLNYQSYSINIHSDFDDDLIFYSPQVTFNTVENTTFRWYNMDFNTVEAIHHDNVYRYDTSTTQSTLVYHVDTNFDYSNFILADWVNTSTSSRIESFYFSSKRITQNGFLLGKVKDIRKQNRDDMRPVKIKFEKKFCYMCLSRIAFSKSDSSLDLCGVCAEKSKREKLLSHKSIERTSNRYSFHKLINTNKDYWTVPCLSSEIEPIEKTKRRWHEDRNILSYSDEYTGRVSQRKLAVYHKGFSEFNILGRRHRFLQPKGRVPQEYDRFFEFNNWQEVVLEEMTKLTLN